MLPSFAAAGNRLALALAALRGQGAPAPKPPPVVPLLRPDLARLVQPKAALPAFVAQDAVTRKYLDLLGPLDWAHFPERPANHPWPGELGIERPRLRRQSAIVNQNTLIYVLINLHALQRVRVQKEKLARQPQIPAVPGG